MKKKISFNYIMSFFRNLGAQSTDGNVRAIFSILTSPYLKRQKTKNIGIWTFTNGNILMDKRNKHIFTCVCKLSFCHWVNVHIVNINTKTENCKRFNNWVKFFIS